MKFNGSRSRLVGRGLRAAALAVVISVASSFSVAATPAAAVKAIESTRVADIILLNGGFNAGLRQGMVCRVTRGGADIAEILLVELRPAASAALILSVAPQQSIRPGDLAAVKVLKS